MTNINERHTAPSASTFLRDRPPRPAQRQIIGSSSRGRQARPVPPTPSQTLAQRTHTTFIGTTYKATWEPLQTRIMVAEELNKFQVPPLGDTVKFLDPAGKVHQIGIKIHDERQWFEDGLLQMMQYYNLQSTAEINYTYRLQNYFHLRIWHPNGIGEIKYKEVPQVDHEVKEEPQEIVVIDDDDDDNELPTHGDQILWTSKVTKAMEEGRQGLVILVSLVTSEVHEKQKEIQVKLPGGEIQSWMLLWNTRIANHCRLGQGYYQYCRQARLRQGDELTFWKINGAPHYGLQVKRQRN
ncbi:DNA-binding barrel domain superfamily [Sesbania bispinosa]|nr:DNA-binding barrel domain superfamily [Sesbania bispinosa]